MEGAELELERRSKFLSSLIQKKKSVEQQDHHDLLNVRVRASDMPTPLQNRAFRSARDHLDSMPGKLDSKRLALALKKPSTNCEISFRFISRRKKKKLLRQLKPETMEISQFMGQQEHEAIENSQDKKAGPPHMALSLISAYLPLFELLAMSGVCTSLRDAVNKDVLSWLDIVVKSPLNLRLSDGILMKITSKANGRLTTLALMDCAKITDDGLQRVVERNPLINKLYLPGCTGLTPEGVIGAVKTLSEHHHGLKSLMINGIYNINKEHLETLRPYLEKNLSQQEQSGSWPLLFHEHRDVPTFRHDKGYATIDVEVCPKCDEVRMVFDCPRRTCKRKIGRSMSDCRGCNFCIPRCQECGGCVDDSEEVEEAVCADILCSDCWLQLPKCDFCNKPYCKQHAHNGSCPPGSTGFVCDVCWANFNI